VAGKWAYLETEGVCRDGAVLVSGVGLVVRVFSAEARGGEGYFGGRIYVFMRSRRVMSVDSAINTHSSMSEITPGF
jgi:hypothetical protein